MNKNNYIPTFPFHSSINTHLLSRIQSNHFRNTGLILTENQPSKTEKLGEKVR